MSLTMASTAVTKKGFTRIFLNNLRKLIDENRQDVTAREAHRLLWSQQMSETQKLEFFVLLASAGLASTSAGYYRLKAERLWNKLRKSTSKETNARLDKRLATLRQLLDSRDAKLNDALTNSANHIGKEVVVANRGAGKRRDLVAIGQHEQILMMAKANDGGEEVRKVANAAVELTKPVERKEPNEMKEGLKVCHLRCPSHALTSHLILATLLKADARLEGYRSADRRASWLLQPHASDLVPTYGDGGLL